MRVEQRPVPRRAPDHALVRPLRVGICGTDFHIFEGKHPFLQYPRVMGHELAVEVVEAPHGSDLTPGEVCAVNPYLACGQCHACLLGRPNCCLRLSVLGVHQDGGMTELMSLPASSLIRTPGLSADECATVEFLAIGAHAVRRAEVRGGERALVLGAGPIGLGTALFARLAGAEVVLLDINAERAAAVGSIAGVTVLPEGTDPSDGLDGFEVVFDATGNPRSMERALDFAGHAGRCALLSVVNESISFKDPDFHRKELTLFASRNATLEDFERVLAAIREGDVAVARLVTHRTRLEDAARDLPLWAKEKTGLIKALIEIP